MHNGTCVVTYNLLYTKASVQGTCAVSHTTASVDIEVDVRGDKKHLHTFVYIKIDKWFVFFSVYFLHSYSNVRDGTLLGGIWIIMVL